MGEEFVGRIEFNLLKDEVNEMKKDMAENQKLLQSIDKKLDVISEKFENSEKVYQLKIQALEDRTTKLENNKEWLWRTVGATAIGIVIKVIFDVSKLL